MTPTYSRLKAIFSLLLIVLLPSAAAADPPQYTVQVLEPSGFGFFASFVKDGLVYGSGAPVGANYTHILRLNLAADTWTDLTPSLPPTDIFSNAAAADYVVGGISSQSGQGPFHASLCQIESDTVQDLHSWGVAGPHSVANGITDSYVIGQSDDGIFKSYAALWEINTQSYFNLDPTGMGGSAAKAILGTLIVGDAGGHAYVWDATTRMGIDIQPNIQNISIASATCVSPLYIGGIANYANGFHPLLWDRSTFTARDVNPVGKFSSQIYSINDDYAVGVATDSVGRNHATLWDVLTGVSFDLHALLGADYATFDSELSSIDTEGNLLGSLTDLRDGSVHNFVLRPVRAVSVPEPASLSLLGFAGVLSTVGAGSRYLLLRRRRGRVQTGAGKRSLGDVMRYRKQQQ